MHKLLLCVCVPVQVHVSLCTSMVRLTRTYVYVSVLLSAYFCQKYVLSTCCVAVCLPSVYGCIILQHRHRRRPYHNHRCEIGRQREKRAKWMVRVEEKKLTVKQDGSESNIFKWNSFCIHIIVKSYKFYAQRTHTKQMVHECFMGATSLPSLLIKKKKREKRRNRNANENTFFVRSSLCGRFICCLSTSSRRNENMNKACN